MQPAYIEVWEDEQTTNRRHTCTVPRLIRVDQIRAIRPHQLDNSGSTKTIGCRIVMLGGEKMVSLQQYAEVRQQIADAAGVICAPRHDSYALPTDRGGLPRIDNRRPDRQRD